MTRGSVTVRDMGWRKIKAAAKELDGAGVKVGIRARDAGKKGADGDTDVIDYALWNELGTSRIPKRPFMRHTADTTQAEVGTYARRLAGMVSSGTLGVDAALHSLGQYYKMRIQASIRGSRAWAVPNAPATVAAKGSSTPLVQHGVLVNTIDYEFDKR